MYTPVASTATVASSVTRGMVCRIFLRDNILYMGLILIGAVCLVSLCVGMYGVVNGYQIHSTLMQVAGVGFLSSLLLGALVGIGFLIRLFCDWACYRARAQAEREQLWHTRQSEQARQVNIRQLDVADFPI